MLLGGGELSRNWRERTLFSLDIYFVAGSCNKKVRDNARIIKRRFPLIVRCIQYLDFKYVKKCQAETGGHQRTHARTKRVYSREPEATHVGHDIKT